MLWSEAGVPGGFWSGAHFVGKLLNAEITPESARRWSRWLLCVLLVCVAQVPAGAPAAQEAEAPQPQGATTGGVNTPESYGGSVVGMVVLDTAEQGMAISAGMAVALPFVGFRYGVGSGAGVDWYFTYESLVGLLHDLSVGVRWTPWQVGDWQIGGRLATAFNFFGLVTESPNFTSTLYLVPELGAGVVLGAHSELALGLAAELDLLEWVQLGGEVTTEGQFRFDAALFRIVWRTELAAELDVFVSGRIRIPVGTFEIGREHFRVVPYAEFGGSWAW